MSQDSGVLDLKWDDGPRHLKATLVDLGFDVEVSHGPPTSNGADCYVIPAQNGASFYANSEDMAALAAYVAEGGLVSSLGTRGIWVIWVIWAPGSPGAPGAPGLGSCCQPRRLGPTSDAFQAEADTGSWGLCKSFGSNARHSNGQPSISAEAKAFLPGAAWPEQLEDARVTSVGVAPSLELAGASFAALCIRRAGTMTRALYHVLDDPNKVVAQAFGKVGSAGAVVWLGYSWKDGSVAQWGALLRAVIDEFGNVPDNSFVLTITPGVSTGTACLVIQAAINAISNTAIGKAPASYTCRNVAIAIFPVYQASVLFNTDEDAASTLGGIHGAVGAFLASVATGEVTYLNNVVVTPLGHRRMSEADSLASAEHVWNERQLQELEVQRLQEQSAAIDYQDVQRRIMQATGGTKLLSGYELAVGVLVISIVEVPLPPSPPSPPPRPFDAPGLPPLPPLKRFAKFKGLYGMGVYLNKTLPVVWYDTKGFRQVRTPRSSLNLVYWTRLYECGVLTPGSCTQCPRAWVAETTRNVTILFREPWQLDAIHIRQLQNPGVLVVELLPWPAVSISGLVDSKGNAVPPVAGTLPPPIRNVTVDSSLCSSTLDINLTPARASTNLPVPRKGSQASIPTSLKATAYGGINIIVKVQATKPNTWIDSVTFDGRALYPADANFYSGNEVRVYG
ncbi:hypothetical protein TSOC_010168 [Tetrabaena socialis]|uniref:Uncharacterized protein n=1 Tax=Tetrabaena socialis TaxID=47790 RepID=A0A2J7ZTZ4_9CHLO|nr:hypothetical protein TSOC_010168 [Tetrabaena socialis]|eukprot:PNH03747.1 hypothetical protein TSOC_010168 [Tetrabaena socialis]